MWQFVDPARRCLCRSSGSFLVGEGTLRSTVCGLWSAFPKGLAVRSAHLPAGQGVQHRHRGVLPEAMKEVIPVGRRRQDLQLHERVG